MNLLERNSFGVHCGIYEVSVKSSANLNDAHESIVVGNSVARANLNLSLIGRVLRGVIVGTFIAKHKPLVHRRVLNVLQFTRKGWSKTKKFALNFSVNWEKKLIKW